MGIAWPNPSSAFTSSGLASGPKDDFAWRRTSLTIEAKLAELVVSPAKDAILAIDGACVFSTHIHSKGFGDAHHFDKVGILSVFGKLSLVFVCAPSSYFLVQWL